MAAILTTWLPFVAFLLIIVFIRGHRRLSGGIAVASAGISLVGAVFLLVRHWSFPHPIHYSTRWFVAGDIYVPFGYLLDPISLLMLCLVAAISFLVQIYSLGYMAEDAGILPLLCFSVPLRMGHDDPEHLLGHASALRLLGVGRAFVVSAHRLLVRESSAPLRRGRKPLS